jgi:flagellar biosynthesis chaperone FliJ
VRPKQRAAEAAEVAAEAETAEARAVLAMSRAAVRAVEEILARHAEGENRNAERRAQHALDEVAQRSGKGQ